MNVAAMNESSRYLKIVEWSEGDGCFMGQCPGIIGPCCHGNDEAAVYTELCGIVEEWLEIMDRENRTLPPPTAGRRIPERIFELS